MEHYFTERYWNRRSHKAFMDWVDEQPVNWAVTTFNCYTMRFSSNNALIAALMKLQIEQSMIAGTLEEQFSAEPRIDWQDIIRDSPLRKRKRYPCTIKAITDGFGHTVKALDLTNLKTSERKKGIKLLRVPYLGGDRQEGVPYHIHSLIQIPHGVGIDELRSYLGKVFQSAMQQQLKSKGKFIVASKVWCEPYEKIGDKFLNYCGRHEGASLSVGLDKVVFPHLIMNPPLVGAI